MEKQKNQNKRSGGGADFLNKDAHIKKNKKRAVKVFLVLLFIVCLIRISYGYISKIINGSILNNLTAGILDLDLYEGKEVTIENLYPLADPVGLIQEESFNFKLINKTSTPTNYILKLQRVETQDELALTDVVYGLTKDNTSSTALLSELEEANYIMDSGTIKGDQTINYELRFWLREDVWDVTTVKDKTLKYKIVVEVSQYLTFNDLLKNKVDTKTTIDFMENSGKTNGRGIYKYQEDGEDIYYWRGNIDTVATEENGIGNHVIFGGFCWEAVRTTSTGGLKMIYDGMPVEVDGKQTCPNTGIDSQLETTSAFNSTVGNSGYMYGQTPVMMVKKASNEELTTSGILYGYDVEWTGTEYELKAKDGESLFSSIGSWEIDRTSVANGNHYTCFNIEGKCKTVNYVYYTDNLMHYIELSGGITIEKVLNQMNNNEKSSTIKATIESWFESTDLDDEENLKKLEDVVYCDDRSVTDTNHGWCKDGEGTIYMRYSTFTRRENGTPNLSCRQTIGNRDRFTYKDIVNGNGLLNWPVGLLTADEIMLAGGQNSDNSDFYLYTGQGYWALSPIIFSGDNSHSFHVHGNGVLSNNFTFNLSGVRPVISLSSSVLPNLSGIGTEVDPYVVN